MEFHFDKEKHLYTLDDVIIPSVTQVLGANGFYSHFGRVNPLVMERASNYGDAYHDGTAFWDNGTLNIDTLDPILVPLLEAWIICQDFYGMELEAIEKPDFSLRYRYGFKIDRVLRITKGDRPKWIGKRAILDLKTGVDGIASDLQLAGYQEGWNENHPEAKADLRLIFQPKEDGTYKIRECLDKRDRNIFLACVNITNYKKSKGIYYERASTSHREEVI